MSQAMRGSMLVPSFMMNDWDRAPKDHEPTHEQGLGGVDQTPRLKYVLIPMDDMGFSNIRQAASQSSATNGKPVSQMTSLTSLCAPA